MGIENIVILLRELAPRFENKQVSLPVELVDIINGTKEEKAWTPISAGTVLRYLADMLEE